MNLTRKVTMAIALSGSLAVALEAQNINITRANDAVMVKAPGLGVIKGEMLTRLKDGRPVRVDFDLAVLPGPGGPAATRARQTFVLSYDLWEQRFAVMLVASPPRSASYLTASATEAWCLEHVTIPVGALGRLRDAPFWIRLEYRTLNGDGASDPDDGGGLTLKGLIDALSRRTKANPLTHTVEAGPFRLGS